jgi:hypothetical protein
LRDEVLKKKELFSKNRGLAAFVAASAFAQSSGATRRRGRPQQKDLAQWPRLWERGHQS